MHLLVAIAMVWALQFQPRTQAMRELAHQSIESHGVVLSPLKVSLAGASSRGVAVNEHVLRNSVLPSDTEIVTGYWEGDSGSGMITLSRLEQGKGESQREDADAGSSKNYADSFDKSAAILTQAQEYQVEEDHKATLVLSTAVFPGCTYFCCSIRSIIGMSREGHVDDAIFGFLYFIEGAAATWEVAQWQIWMTPWASAIFLGSRDRPRWLGVRATHWACESDASNGVSTTGRSNPLVGDHCLRGCAQRTSYCVWMHMAR